MQIWKDMYIFHYYMRIQQKPAIWLFLSAMLLLTTASPSIWGHMTFLLHCSCPCCCSCLPCKDIYRSTEASLAILPLFAFHHVCRSEASLVIQKHHCFDTKPGFILHTSEHTSKTTIRFIFFRVIVPLEGFKIRNAAGEWWVLWSWKYGHESGS